MSDLDNSSSSFNAKEETSNSFAESDEKSIKSPVQNSEDNDSEVERSDNESVIENVDENRSESNEQVINQNEDNSNSSNEHSIKDKIQQNDENSKDNLDEDSKDSKDNLNENKEDENKDNENKDDEKGEDENEDKLSAKVKENADSDSDMEEKNNEEEDDEQMEINAKLHKKKKETDEIFGDSDSENDEPLSSTNKRKIFDDSDNDSEEEFFTKKKKSAIIKDSDDESDNQSDLDNRKLKAKKRSNDEDELNEQDEDKNDDQGDNQTSSQKEDKELDDNDKVLPDISSSSSEDELEDDRSKRGGSDLMYDFDIMMAKRKEQNARNRKRRNVDLINDSDDFIADLLNQMKQAAEDDFELNKNRKAATRKMKLLPTVQIYLRKIDLRESFLDSGVLSVITDWLTPLPDRSLPNLQVRETMLKLLLELNIMDVDRLKSSSIGKAVMYLFKHPKETKENKRRAAQLISNWSKPIFNCETDYQSISKEDREQRDYDLMTKVHKRKAEESATNSQMENQTTLRPGDKGWVPRARVPAPSTKDYVIRPKSTVEVDIGKSSSRKPVSRLDKHLRTFKEKKRTSKMQRAVKIVISK